SFSCRHLHPQWVFSLYKNRSYVLDYIPVYVIVTAIATCGLVLYYGGKARTILGSGRNDERVGLPIKSITMRSSNATERRMPTCN
ncbi:MAG: hypothetical protein RSB16_06000, partial [Raoultibacter sp.]